VTCRRVNITTAAYIEAGMSIDSVVLSEDRQLELNRIAQSSSLPAGCVFRARHHSDAGRRNVLQHDQAEGGDGADDQPVEAALPCFGN
jgi:hypothetical protein